MITFLITISTVVLSVIITSILLLLLQGYVDQVGLIISIIAPSLILPLPAVYFFKLVLKLDQTEKALHDKNKTLERALKEVKELSGLLPICAHCKKIRDDKGYWNQIETYIEANSNAEFSHGYCDSCIREIYENASWRKQKVS
ncbi:MAG: hypothetical protein D3926_02755 [Desulfobacteraceae bacterium]|nr:MAG: hypothetical protein D3926_02755 [Desulfobacteraceae bacterium]